MLATRLPEQVSAACAGAVATTVPARASTPAATVAAMFRLILIPHPFCGLSGARGRLDPGGSASGAGGAQLPESAGSGGHGQYGRDRRDRGLQREELCE